MLSIILLSCMHACNLYAHLQVLSNSISKALTLLVGDEATETAKFAEMFNKFFDCLNASNFTVGKQQRNVFKNPYYSAEDFRLTVGPHMRTININYAIFS